MSLFKRPKNTTRYSLEQYAQDVSFAFGGASYSGIGGNAPIQTTWSGLRTEPIGDNFTALALSGMKQSGPVFSCMRFRAQVLSEARFIYQRLMNGRPGDLFGSASLAPLEQPWPGGTTGDLIARMVMHADLAGSAFAWRSPSDEIAVLRPDQMDIILEARESTISGKKVLIGWKKLAYLWWQNSRTQTTDPVVLLPDEVAHFAPIPDPLAEWRGMSWLTPVIREIQADKLASTHKNRWFENSATPNIAVSLKEQLTREQFDKFVETMERQHKGVDKTGKTLYLAGGADVTVIGKDMKEMDFSSVTGKGETRIANAAGIHPVVLGFSEGLSGSSLNAGNYGAAKRNTTDGTLKPTWRNLAGSMQVLFSPPPGSPARLWYDQRDVSFCRDDEQDVARIQAAEATTIRTLLDAGFTPDSVQAAVMANDWSLLRHSGLYSVQLQAPGTGNSAPADGGNDA